MGCASQLGRYFAGRAHDGRRPVGGDCCAWVGLSCVASFASLWQVLYKQMLECCLRCRLVSGDIQKAVCWLCTRELPRAHTWPSYHAGSR